MKAAVCTRYGPPDVLQLREVGTPAPRSEEVLIRMQATAVTYSDCVVRAAALPAWQPMGFAMRLAIGFTKPRQPILGIVVAGEIESVGKDVRTFKRGDPVFGWDLFPGFGAYAEYKRMSARGMLAIKPANLSYEEAAAIPYGGLLALHLLRKGSLQSGQKVLIYGASGAVGTSAVQLARTFGAAVTGVCGSANLELVKSLGADAVIDYTTQDGSHAAEIYDCVLDAAGKRKSSPLKRAYQQSAARHGRYVSIDDGAPRIGLEDLVRLRELVEAGKIRPVIDRIFPLERIAEAHGYVEQGHKKGNVVITVE